MFSGVLWFSLASSLDQRRSGLPTTPLDEHFEVPLAVKVRHTIEGSLVLRLYVALVYMREGVSAVVSLMVPGLANHAAGGLASC